jgi:peptidoglycan L-alanyl-D-glutamate endopeptidase CwlK
MKNWSKSSVKYINTVHHVLQKLAQKLTTVTPYELRVLNTGGKRDAEMQNLIFKQGTSKCDGYVKKSYHQSGLAIDFVPMVNEILTWSNKKAFLSVAKVIFEIWEEMILSGENEGYYLHWGGFWNAKDLDNDNLLELTDKLGWDAAHYELREYPQKNTKKISLT